MANELLPHYHARMPAAAAGSLGYLDAAGGVSHAYASRFPTGYAPTVGDDQTLDPIGGVEVATGIDEVVGEEGVMTPYGAGGFADLTALIAAGPTANPATQWDTGSYITLSDGSLAHWGTTGSAWTVGAAP